MPNWCSCFHAVEGKYKDVRKFCDYLNEVRSNDKKVKTDFNWGLESLLLALGEITPEQVKKNDIPEKLTCRGSFTNPEEWEEVMEEYEDEEISDDEECYVTFQTEEAWGVQEMWATIFHEKFPELKWYVCAEEPGNGYYVNTDREEKYWQDRFIIEIWNDNDDTFPFKDILNEELFNDEYGPDLWRIRCDTTYANKLKQELVKNKKFDTLKDMCNYLNNIECENGVSISANFYSKTLD